MAHQLFIDFKKAYVTLGARECTYNIPIQFSTPTKLDSLITARFNKT